MNTKESHTSSTSVKCLAAVLASAMALSGCATSSVMDSHKSVSSKVTKQVLVEDQVIALGKPAQPLANMPVNSVVIVGEKNSYVLSQGGTEMVTLLSGLDPKYVQVDKAMEFYSANNDGYFSGNVELSYARLKDEFQRNDYQFFLQNNGKDCTSQNDLRINAQRFCFNIPIKGGTYPQAKNYDIIRAQLRPLSKPYPVSVYTNTTETTVSRGGYNPVEKLVLLPFALAFDVVTLPLQIIFD